MKHETNKTRLMELAGLREVDPIGDIRKSISVVKLTQQNWVKMTPEQQGNALLSVMDDIDEAESYIGADWSDLPSQATANMMTFVKSGGMNEAVDPNQMLKLEVTVKAGTIIDMFGGAEVLSATINDPNKFRDFTRTIEEDLANWLAGPGGDEWANEGVESSNYDDFIPFN